MEEDQDQECAIERHGHNTEHLNDGPGTSRAASMTTPGRYHHRKVMGLKADDP